MSKNNTSFSWGSMNSRQTQSAINHLLSGKTSKEVFNIVKNYKGISRNISQESISALRSYLTRNGMLDPVR